jgi:hypothetical protein
LESAFSRNRHPSRAACSQKTALVRSGCRHRGRHPVRDGRSISTEGVALPWVVAGFPERVQGYRLETRTVKAGANRTPGGALRSTHKDAVKERPVEAHLSKIGALAVPEPYVRLDGCSRLTRVCNLRHPWELRARRSATQDWVGSTRPKLNASRKIANGCIEEVGGGIERVKHSCVRVPGRDWMTDRTSLRRWRVTKSEIDDVPGSAGVRNPDPFILHLRDLQVAKVFTSKYLWSTSVAVRSFAQS